MSTPNPRLNNNSSKTNNPQNFTTYNKAQADSYSASRRDYHPTLYSTVLNYHFNNKPPNPNPNPNLLLNNNHNHNHKHSHIPNKNENNKNENTTTLLDVGCGTGFAARALAPYFSRTIAIDPSEGMLQSARTGFPDPDSVIYACSTAGELGSNLSPSVFGIIGDDGNGRSVDLLVAASAAHHWLSPSLSVSSFSSSSRGVNNHHHHHKRDQKDDENDEIAKKNEKEKEEREGENNNREAKNFYTRAAKILKPNGTVALWAASTILIPSSTPNHEALQAILDESLYGFLSRTEGGVFCSEKDRVVWRGCRGLILPFSSSSLSSLSSSAGHASLDPLSGGLSSSSLGSGLGLPLSSGGMPSKGMPSVGMSSGTGKEKTEDDDPSSSFVGEFDESSFVRIEFGNASSSKARDDNRNDEEAKDKEKKPDSSTWTLPGNEFYNVNQSDSFTLAQLEKILGMATPVVRWRAAHPNLCNTEEDIVRKTIWQMEEALRGVGADVNGPVWDGSVCGVLLMFKKKGDQQGLDVSLSSGLQ